MSTPTINTIQGASYPSLGDIMNLVRSLVNDSQAGSTGTPGEGQILTDNPQISPFTQPFLNSSIREVYRELRNVGQPALIKDNVIIQGLPPMNSPTNGPASPDPAVQVNLGFGGFFDGVQIQGNFLLPEDLMYPEKVWERETATNNPFVLMVQPEFGIPGIGLQGSAFVAWEWRGDAIWMPGATTSRDLRLRYYAALPQFFSDTLDFDSTFVPILDSIDAIAYKTASKYATMLGSPGKEMIALEAKEQMFQLKNANTRRMQSVNYIRQPYGHYKGGDGAYGYGFGNSD
jgi:hypothetical protein